MLPGQLSPLQLTAAAGLFDNQGIRPLPAVLTAAVASWQATTVITAIDSALSDAQDSTWCSISTLTDLQTLRGTGNGCPALGNSIPPAYINLAVGPDPDQPGLSGLILQTGNAYLGDGDAGRFAQGFMSVQGLVQQTNEFITSATNAQTYLGPTFPGMPDLVTNNIASVNSNFAGFSTDLANQGSLSNFARLPFYGTPAGLLAQIAEQGNMLNGSLAAVQDALFDQGLTQQDIADLVNLNIVSLFNPSGLSVKQFDALQKRAYPALARITGSDLEDIRKILGVSTPNLATAADLLDPRKIFPDSYATLQTPTVDGYRPVFNPDGSVNFDLQSQINNFISTPSGCDQLGKIIPPDQAVANKAIQSALQQIGDIQDTTAPALAQAIRPHTRTAWNPAQSYQRNALTADAPRDAVTGLAVLSPDTVFYRAQQNVPVGTDITDTAYWQPTQLGELCDLATLDQIVDQEQPLPAAVEQIYATEVATGTGPDGTITTCDVIGTAINRGNLQIYLDAATSALQDIINDGGAATLLDIYSRMANVADGSYGDPVLGPVTVPAGAGAGTYITTFAVYAGDAALQVLIPLANTEIDNVIAAYPSETQILSTNWNSVASILDQEKGYQIQADLDYFALPAGDRVSIMSFVQSLPAFGQQGAACGPFDFLQQMIDMTSLTGQAIEGSLCEGENQRLLGSAGMGTAVSQLRPSSDLAVTPSRVVTG